MKKHGSSRKLVIVLLTSVSATAALSACTSAKSLLDDWTNDREDQVVVGGKRPPALNPRYMPAPEVVTPSDNPVVYERKQAMKPEAEMEAPKAETAKRAPTFEESPFDYFDNEGNSVEPKKPEVAAAPAQSNQVTSKDTAGEENFFTRLFGTKREPTEVEKLRGTPRKPLLDNQYAPVQPLAPMSDNNAASQPAAMPVVESVKPVEMKPEPAPWMQAEKQAPAQTTFMPAPPLQPQAEPVMHTLPEEHVTFHAQPVEVDEDAVTLPPVEVSESRKKPNWFERTFTRIENTFSSDDQAEQSGDDMSADDMAYPKLASVPQTPERFSELRDDKQNAMEAMQSEHMQAQQDKYDLFSEPSGVEATVPVEIAQPKAVKPIVAEPVVTAPVVAKTAPPQAEGEVLLGHASVAPVAAPDDVPVKMESAVMQPAEPVKAEETFTQKAMAEEEPSQESMTAAEQTRQNRWWEGWRIFSAEAKKPESELNADMQEEAAQEMPAPVVQRPEPAPLQPMVAQPVVTPAQPMVQMPDAMVKEAPQVAEAEEAEMLEEAKPAAGALPSPQILREVKMLPPSRYSARARSTSTQAQ